MRLVVHDCLDGRYVALREAIAAGDGGAIECRNTGLLGLVASCVPTFHHHLWQRGRYIVDEHGASFDGDQAAVEAARLALCELLADDLRSGKTPLNRCVVVTDERGCTIAQIGSADILNEGEATSA